MPLQVEGGELLSTAIILTVSNLFRIPPLLRSAIVGATGPVTVAEHGISVLIPTPGDKDGSGVYKSIWSGVLRTE